MTCPLCSSPFATTEKDLSGRDASCVECNRCGNFRLTETLLACLPQLLLKHDSQAKLSHVVRKAFESNENLMLDLYTAEAVLKNPLPRPREQADLLIQFLAINSPGPGEPIAVEYDDHAAIIGAKSHAGFTMIIDHLLSVDLITGLHTKFISGESKSKVALTFSGWDYYENLRLGGATYRKAFMAMKFGDSALNSLLEQVLKPAANRAGFDLFKLDDRPKAGLIDDRMRVDIRASDFVIADLTHDNLGAYWEAGYAEGLGKPVIYTCERTKFDQAKTHFDTNHHLTIVWDSAMPALAGIQLTETIRATLPHLAKLTDS